MRGVASVGVSNHAIEIPLLLSFLYLLSETGRRSIHPPVPKISGRLNSSSSPGPTHSRCCYCYTKTQFRLLGTIKPKINCSFAFKRCVNANQAKVVEIRENKHEKATKHSTFWAVNVVILGVQIIAQRYQPYDVQFILTFI